MWQIGDRVLARWPGERQWWYPGVICEVEESRYVVQFDDGDRSAVFPFEVRSIELPPRTTVQVRFGRELRFLPAVTVARQEGQALLLRAPDGAEVWTSVAMVRVDLGSPLEDTFS